MMSDDKKDEKAEADVDRDDARADSRATGGEPDEAQADQNSTTGPTPNEDFVGRVAGSDADGSEETGAERRAEADRAGD